MKPKEFIKKLKDLKVRRFEKNEYAKSIGSGGSSLDTTIDDVVMFMHNQDPEMMPYTSYDEIPQAPVRQSVTERGIYRVAEDSSYPIIIPASGLGITELFAAGEYLIADIYTKETPGPDVS